MKVAGRASRVFLAMAATHIDMTVGTVSPSLPEASEKYSVLNDKITVIAQCLIEFNVFLENPMRWYGVSTEP